ncbi:MAG TPA: class I SAM-dependent methyltransferase [Tepidisphaeraceae bacterium]|nr:class I SAM-dependent methyltransferase [Tepidisphaeraceae bacterium]
MSSEDSTNQLPAPLVGAGSYDAVPYRGQPFKQTHPAMLAAVARMVGLDAPAAETCRVLELGCCDGGNLIPMAEEQPRATFVGIDYSPVQIEMGRKRVTQLGLKNLDLRPISILDFPADEGPFDYIISHGVFSWVPPPVRESILDLCARHLSPNGIAYISYNTFPGWHMSSIVRDMMRYHALRFDTPQRQIQEARLILEFVSRVAAGRHAESYAMFLKAEAELLNRLPDHYLFHEHLEDYCQPYYFKDFVAMARTRGLDFLAESRLAAMAPTNFGPEAEQMLSAISTNVIELEQFMDFLRSRTFRETLLHHAGRTPSYELRPESLRGLFVSSTLRPTVQSLDLRPQVAQTFESHSKHSVSISSPLVKAGLFCLAKAFPASIEFDALITQANAQLDKLKIPRGEPTKDVQSLGKALLTLLTTSDSVDVRTTPSNFITTPTERPSASPYSRLQAPDQTELIVNRRHESIRLDEFGREVLQRLDGSHSAAEIAQSIGKETTELQVRNSIDHIARLAVLIG